jgi:hypothetical protein
VCRGKKRKKKELRQGVFNTCTCTKYIVFVIINLPAVQLWKHIFSITNLALILRQVQLKDCGSANTDKNKGIYYGVLFSFFYMCMNTEMQIILYYIKCHV